MSNLQLATHAPSSLHDPHWSLYSWLTTGLEFTTPLNLYFRLCYLQYWPSLLLNILRFAPLTIFGGLFHSLIILLLRSTYANL